MTKKLLLDAKSLGWVAIISLVACVVLATLVYFTTMQEKALKTLSTAVLIISIMAGGISAGKSYASKGLIHGTRIGLLTFLLILIASLVTNPELIKIKSFIATMTVCLLSGGIGGIIGIGINETGTES
jgi:putative membrane protein (TIGR04086 family)